MKTKPKAKPKKKAIKLWHFHQNNSGGRYIVDSTIGKNVYIQAQTKGEAIEKAKKIGLFSLPFCECCGPRFSEWCWPATVVVDEDGYKVPKGFWDEQDSFYTDSSIVYYKGKATRTNYIPF